jgi:hypothetical protein
MSWKCCRACYKNKRKWKNLFLFIHFAGNGWCLDFYFPIRKKKIEMFSHKISRINKIERFCNPYPRKNMIINSIIIEIVQNPRILWIYVLSVQSNRSLFKQNQLYTWPGGQCLPSSIGCGINFTINNDHHQLKIEFSSISNFSLITKVKRGGRVFLGECVSSVEQRVSYNVLTLL